MKILMDTHIALWSITDSSRLTDEMKSMLEDSDNSIYYSIVSVWEIAIKHKLHPKQMEISEEQFESLCQKAGFNKLGLSSGHIYNVKTLIWNDNGKEHMDPFDRILLSQAIVENMKFMTSDGKISLFKQNCVISV